MPLYEYKCRACGETFEVIQKFADEPLKTHPECGGEVERLISASALQFKGSGWYVTDYAKRNGGSKSEGQSEGKADGKPEGKPGAGEKSGEKKSGSESSGGDAKPAAASESKSSPKSSAGSGPDSK